MDILNSYINFIFDLDGTLIDSMNVWSEVDKLFLNERGIELTKEYTDKVKSSAMADSAKFTVERYGLNETPEQVMDIWNSMVYEAYRSRIKLKPGALTFLKKIVTLKEKNPDIRIAVATALSNKNANAALKANNIDGLFDVILTLDDLGGTIDKTKPDIYIEVLERMGSNKCDKTIVFEDVFAAARGAMDGGFDVCAVYDEVGSSSDWDEMRALTKFSITDWNQIC